MTDFAARMGTARATITPSLTLPQRLWGAAKHDYPTGIHAALTLTALAVESDAGERLLLLVADLCEWRNAADEVQVRRAAAQACGLDIDSVVLHSTHAHSAIAPDTSDPLHRDENLAYLATIEEAARTVATEAFAHACRSTLSWATGSSSIAAVRDELRDGTSVVGRNPLAIADDTLLVGRVTDDEGQIVAVIVNYACHPTVLGWGNTLISPDFVGALRDEVERRHPGALCLFIQGASGELAPASQYLDDPAAADRVGRSLGLSVNATLQVMDPPGHALHPGPIVESGARLGTWVLTAEPARTDLHRATAHIELERADTPDPVASDTDARTRAERSRRAERVAALSGDGDTITYEVSVWQLGDLVMVIHAGEAYSWLQRALRAHLTPRPVVVANLTNGAGAFYLPTTQAYREHAYPAVQTPVAPGSLERVFETAVELIERDSSSSAHHDIPPHPLEN